MSPSVPPEPVPGTAHEPASAPTTDAVSDPAGTATNQADASAAETLQAPPQKSHYAVTKENTSLRNITWALGLTMVVVAAVAVLFFGVGNELDREIPETSRLDVQASAERAQALADFPLAVPATSAQWTAREATFSGADVPSWQLRYTSPAGELVTMDQTAELSPAALSAAVPGAAVDAQVEIAGAECEQMYSTSDEDLRAVACTGEGWALVVHGDTEQAELEALAGSAIESIAAKG